MARKTRSLEEIAEEVAALRAQTGQAEADTEQVGRDAKAHDDIVAGYVERGTDPTQPADPYILAKLSLLPIKDFLPDRLHIWHQRMAKFEVIDRETELGLLKLARKIDPDYVRQTLLPFKRFQRSQNGPSIPKSSEIVPDDQMTTVDAAEPLPEMTHSGPPSGPPSSLPLHPSIEEVMRPVSTQPQAPTLPATSTSSALPVEATTGVAYAANRRPWRKY